MTDEHPMPDWSRHATWEARLATRPLPHGDRRAMDPRRARHRRRRESGAGESRGGDGMSEREQLPEQAQVETERYEYVTEAERVLLAERVFGGASPSHLMLRALEDILRARITHALAQETSGPGWFWTRTEWAEWSNALAMLIPEDDVSRYSNPDGAQEGIILDCLRAYVAERSTRPASTLREHGYAGWRDGAAYCLCGRTFDSVQDLDRHVNRPASDGGAV